MENSKTRSEAAILVLVVFILGVLLGGLGNHLWGERVWGHAYPPGMPLHTQIVSELTRQLALTPDQQQQLGVIVDDTKSKIHAAYAPADAQREQLRQQGRARIRAILTPEQLPKFEAFMARIDEQRKKNQSNTSLRTSSRHRKYPATNKMEGRGVREAVAKGVNDEAND